MGLDKCRQRLPQHPLAGLTKPYEHRRPKRRPQHASSHVLAVHPDAAETPLAWGGAATQLFVTPYPYGDATKENPSLYGGSLLEWLAAPGVRNPIAHPPVAGYLSDPDEVFNPETSELWLYYRAVTNG